MSKRPLIYGIQCDELHPDTGRITFKIGFTDDIKERLRKLQTPHASILKYMNRVYVPAELMQLEEDLAHDYFSDYRLEGEHFDISLEQLNGYFETRQNEYKQIEGLDGEIIIKKRFLSKIRIGPPCYFYDGHQAQDKGNSKSSIKKPIDSVKYRTMTWSGVSQGHPSYAGKDKNGTSKVYISHKKHLENIEQMHYEKSKKNQSDLESFF